MQYVALPDAPLTSVGAKEADLIATRLPYLEPVWLNSHWTLYEVLDATALVDPPGQVVPPEPGHDHDYRAGLEPRRCASPLVPLARAAQRTRRRASPPTAST